MGEKIKVPYRNIVGQFRRYMSRWSDLVNAKHYSVLIKKGEVPLHTMKATRVCGGIAPLILNLGG